MSGNRQFGQKTKFKSFTYCVQNNEDLFTGFSKSLKNKKASHGTT